MITTSALAGAVLFSRAGDTVEVLTAGQPITKGHAITRDDLATTRVAGIEDTFGAADASSVIGTTAAVDMVAGQVLTSGMLTTEPTPVSGKATVGLSLDPARAPTAGLMPGDVVDVVAVPAGSDGGGDPDALDAPPLLARGAQVFDISGTPTEGGGVLVTLVVDESAAGRIAAYSTAGRVAVVETSPARGGAF